MRDPTQIKFLITNFSHRVSITIAIIICVGQLTIFPCHVIHNGSKWSHHRPRWERDERPSQVIIVRRVECGVFPLNYRAHHASRAICKHHNGKNYLQTWGGNHLERPIFFMLLPLLLIFPSLVCKHAPSSLPPPCSHQICIFAASAQT